MMDERKCAPTGEEHDPVLGSSDLSSFRVIDALIGVVVGQQQ